jgi:8-oxo-dGTP pyrophosphatase MutT (NUDIX family)
MRRMITFDEGSVRFMCRVVGIAFDRDRVLIHRAERDDFWALPGGRAELLEPSAETLRREMQEELGTEITVDRLVWVVENFFEYDGKSCHELGFYYLMSLPTNSPLRDHTDTFFGLEGRLPIIFEWHPITDLENIVLYPTFLCAGLKSMPNETTHIVHTDRK